jgi:hypothetical protein
MTKKYVLVTGCKYPGQVLTSTGALPHSRTLC